MNAPPLTAEERARLVADPRLADYPLREFLTVEEERRLAFIRWLKINDRLFRAE